MEEFFGFEYAAFCNIAAEFFKGANNINHRGREHPQPPFFPIYTCYGYNYSQQTYLASEIVAAGATAGTPGFISSISFNPTSIVASSFSSLCKDWVVYLGNTSKSTFSGTTDWVPFSSLTKVFDGVVTVSGAGWFTISFSTPFYWDGTSNLVVAVDENTPSWYCTASWQATSRTGTRGLLYYSDGTNPNPSSPPTANYSSNIISNIRVAYTPAVPCSGTTVGGSAVASATSLCPGESVSLSVTGATAGTGMTCNGNLHQQLLGLGLRLPVLQAQAIPLPLLLEQPLTIVVKQLVPLQLLRLFLLVLQ